MTMTTADRVSRFEGIVEEIRERLNSLQARVDGVAASLNSRMTAIENRMNVQVGLTVTMWVTMTVLMVTALLRI